MDECVRERFLVVDDFLGQELSAAMRADVGPMDPAEGRLVLHGHISEGGVVAQGSLAPETIRERIDGAIGELRHRARDVRGPFVVQLEIGLDGRVGSIRPILDRMASTNGADFDALRSLVLDRLSAVRFPAMPQQTRANVPLIF